MNFSLYNASVGGKGVNAIDIKTLTPQDIFPKQDLIRIYIELAENFEEEQAYQNELFETKMRVLRWENRLKVPFGRDQKYYKWLLADTKEIIKNSKEAWHKNPKNFLAKHTMEEYIEKEKKIKVAMKRVTNKEDKSVDIAKAKAFPMTQIIDMHRGNVTKCLWHEDKNPSMHYYAKTNHLFCFVCNKKADTIDVVMQLKHIPFIEAVRFLTS